MQRETSVDWAWQTNKVKVDNELTSQTAGLPVLLASTSRPNHRPRQSTTPYIDKNLKFEVLTSLAERCFAARE